MKVSGVVLDPQSRNPIVVLRDLPERRAIMIWIGPPEANSIMLAIESIKLARPATHDLFVNTMAAFGAQVESVTINNMEESTFFAHLKIITPKGTTEDIDSRPSDAIAIALRIGCPIYVAEEVVLSSSIPINPVAEEKDAKNFKSFVQNLKPSDFVGKSREGEN